MVLCALHHHVIHNPTRDENERHEHSRSSSVWKYIHFYFDDLI